MKTTSLIFIAVSVLLLIGSVTILVLFNKENLTLPQKNLNKRAMANMRTRKTKNPKFESVSNVTKLYNSLTKSSKPKSINMTKKLRNQLDRNRAALKSNKKAVKVMSVNGNIYLFDKNNTLVNTIEGFSDCDPSNSRCVAPEECIEESVEDGLLGETRWTCKKREYAWWVIVLIVILAFLFGGSDNNEQQYSSDVMQEPDITSAQARLVVAEEFASGEVENLVVGSEDGETGASRGQGYIKLPDIGINVDQERVLVDSVKILPNIKELLDRLRIPGVDVDEGSRSDGCDCEKLLLSVNRGVPGAFKRYAACCLKPIIRDLPPIMLPPMDEEPPRTGGGPIDIPVVDEEDLPANVAYSFCQGPDEIRVLSDGTRLRETRANVCCEAKCINNSWFKECGTGYSEFSETVPADSGEFWYPMLQTSEFLDIPCTTKKPCFDRNGRVIDCDSQPAGGRSGAGSSTSVVPDVAGNKRVRFALSGI